MEHVRRVGFAKRMRAEGFAKRRYSECCLSIELSKVGMECYENIQRRLHRTCGYTVIFDWVFCDFALGVSGRGEEKG